MSERKVTCEELLDKIEQIRKIVHTNLALYRLVNAEAIEKARKQFLNREPRKRVFTLSDNKRTVTEIAQEIFKGEPIEKSMPKVSYHLAILEEYGFVEHRDEKGVRYYKKRE
ncbi:MAG: winged helix-turn-helix domain-containing protein [Candidatus Bathyarchaeia archaeon]